MFYESQFSHCKLNMIKHGYYYFGSFIIYVRGCSFTGGGQNFFCAGKGGTSIFLRMPRWDQNVLRIANGGTRRNWQPAITKKKKDSSLTRWKIEYIIVELNMLWYLLQTVPSTLFSLYCIASNPVKQKKLRAEVLRLAPPGKPITEHALNRMSYLKACIQEGFR